MSRRYDWYAPAKLFFWPSDGGAEEEAVYPTLKAAIRAASEGDLTHAWIITQDGDILNPRIIEALLVEQAPKRRGFTLFGRAKAA